LLGYISPSASDVSGLIYVDHMIIIYKHTAKDITVAKMLLRARLMLSRFTILERYKYGKKRKYHKNYTGNTTKYKQKPN